MQQLLAEEILLLVIEGQSQRGNLQILPQQHRLPGEAKLLKYTDSHSCR